MSILSQSSIETIIASYGGKASKQVVNAIHKASTSSDIDFSYLLNQAKAESSFDPSAKAKTSSASGLYQFIESTWMSMVERYGLDYGLDTSSMSRADILDLRNDPEIASHMAAKFANENKVFLERHWGGDIGSTELYFAHFMGAGGAAGFLNERDHNPLQIAADLFPKAASANRNVFYESATGKPKTLAGVYEFFDQKFSNTPIQGLEMESPVKKGAIYTNHSPVFQSDAASRSLQFPVENTRSIRAHNSMPIWNLVSSPVELMLIAQMEMDLPFAKSSKSRL